ncbi:TspO/MBR family protein [Streptomyces sp. NBC_00557]|uniref:TspO/MBR family protein n=1 Tax=Streptomyces sp. NBC_00557 TaxID=2975776 RepID=UPI003FCE1C23
MPSSACCANGSPAWRRTRRRRDPSSAAPDRPRAAGDEDHGQRQRLRRQRRTTETDQRAWRPEARSRPAGTVTVTGAAVTVAAAVAGRAVDAGSVWYRSLCKPVRQPLPGRSGAAWTPLYATIAYAGGRALGGSCERRERVHLAASLAAHLTLNAGRSRLFFRLRSPRAGLVSTLLLGLGDGGADASNRANRLQGSQDPAALHAWCLFATALSAALARHHHGAMTVSRCGRA